MREHPIIGAAMLFVACLLYRAAYNRAVRARDQYQSVYQRRREERM